MKFPDVTEDVGEFHFCMEKALMDQAGKSRKVRHAIRGEHEENLSARGWQKEKITIGGHRWSRLTPYDEMTLSYVVLWLRWRLFFSRLVFAPFYEENPHGGIEAQIGLYSY